MSAPAVEFLTEAADFSETDITGKTEVSATNFDIAIIGGGVIGLSLARALSGHQLRVAVIDAGHETPPATDAAAGMLAASFESAAEESMADALFALGAQSLAAWPGFAAMLEDETGQALDYRDDGIVAVAFDEPQAAALKYSGEQLRARGGNASFLDGDAVRQLEPALSDRVVAALYAPGDAQVDPRKLLIALRAAFRKTAGRFFGERVVQVEGDKAGHRLMLSNGERLEAKTVVLASGAAATQLIAGLPPPPITPVKGEALAVQMGAVQMAAVDSGGHKFRHVIRCPAQPALPYLCPKADGRVIIGATEIAGRRDAGVDDASIRKLRAGAADVVPAVRDWPEIERWSGLRPATPDGAPILGRDRRGPDGVFLALGHYRNGILLAPACATALAREILGEGAPSPSPLTHLQPFRPERFVSSPGEGEHG
ncbi:MAG: glycine oxidase ThiO [Alphaproteobacteria bacterium]|nr:glycine oxidase ThiO [Alphaproteobacteria bacterium]